jgi:hypothetical protein
MVLAMVVAPTAVTSLNFNTPVFNKEKVSLARHDEVCSILLNFSLVVVYSRRVCQISDLYSSAT